MTSPFVARGKGVAATVVIVAAATAGQNCGNGDCTDDNCSRWGGSSSVTFQSCVQGSVSNGDGTSESDLVLIDSSGNEVFRCTSKHPPEVTDCDDNFTAKRESFCAQAGGTTTGTGAGSGTGAASGSGSGSGAGVGTGSGSSSGSGG